jgi:hypothetical protein
VSVQKAVPYTGEVNSDALLARIAARQHGAFSYGQAQQCDLSDDQIRHRLRTLRWRQMRRGVYRLVGAPVTWEQTVMAATLAAPGSLASHTTSAALWGLTQRPDTIDLTAERQLRMDGVRAHRSLVAPKDRRIVHSSPLTSPARTLVDLRGRPDLGRLLDDAIRRRLLTMKHFRVCAEPHRSQQLAQLIAQRGAGYDPGFSDWEKRIRELVVADGLPEPVLNYRVRIGRKSYRIDMAYPDIKLGIELDSWEHHDMTYSQFTNDRVRGNALTDWTMLHFSWEMTDDYILRKIRSERCRPRRR